MFEFLSAVADHHKWGLLALGFIVSVVVSLIGFSLMGRVSAHRSHGLSHRDLRQQNRVLGKALNHMGQGLVMFDKDQRLVVCNQQYVQMYGLSVDAVKPGCMIRELLEMRIAAGTFFGDPVEYIATLIHDGAVQNKTVVLPDGRVIAVTNEPTPDNGWVSTHEDVTERQSDRIALANAQASAERAEKEARGAHARLLDAFEAIPEGLVIFDADDRYVMWNRRYGEMYADYRDILTPGVRFEDVLRTGLTRGRYPDARGREEEWLAERMRQHRASHCAHERQRPGDRWLRIEERRTSDGGSIGMRVDITDLKRREASFRLLFDDNPVPMWVHDRTSWRFLAVNDAAVGRYGYSREQFLTLSVDEIHSERGGEERRDETGLDVNDEVVSRHLKANGDVIEAAVYSRMLTYEGHDAVLVAAVDVTKRKQTEDELLRTRTFLRLVIENVPTTIVVKDARDLKYVLLNRAGENMFGIASPEMVGKTAHEVFPHPTADEIAEHDAVLLQSSAETDFGEHTIQTPAGATRLVKARRLSIRDQRGQPQYLLSVIEDVTEQKNADNRITHLALHDALTDLPNRTAFNEHFAATLERARSSGGSFAVLCLDLDRFKEVNDAFGHMIGDALLRSACERMQGVSEGAFLARVGGDEFVLVATGQQPLTAEALAGRLQAAFAADFGVDGHALRVDVSIGVAVFPLDGEDATTLVGNAEVALHQAKSRSRGGIRFFTSAMDRQLRERRAMQNDLRHAVERGEFQLYYQPQARIDRDIVGFEALLRWQRPDRGLISPASFIPIAEESGLVVEIGAWAVRAACREAASWPRPLQVAVNVSAIQFRRGNLPALVHAALLETGLKPERLELEITEGVLIEDVSLAQSVLRQLKVLGVRIALDDFGTGYSSLSYLHSFPLDAIKIDQSFVAKLYRAPQPGAIIRAIIGLAHGLKLPVLAEGVETEDQLAFLSREGCDLIQGYLLGRPLPIEAYAELVGRQRGKPPDGMKNVLTRLG
jgi:diguanylate cyclase (GGDEF)-like protein/PAS domain S-box-containing protein